MRLIFSWDSFLERTRFVAFGGDVNLLSIWLLLFCYLKSVISDLKASCSMICPLEALLPLLASDWRFLVWCWRLIWKPVWSSFLSKRLVEDFERWDYSIMDCFSLLFCWERSSFFWLYSCSYFEIYFPFFAWPLVWLSVLWLIVERALFSFLRVKGIYKWL